jgi:hypothetical protein
MCEKEIGTFGLSMGAEILLEDRTANLVVRLIGGISTRRLKKMGSRRRFAWVMLKRSIVSSRRLRFWILDYENDSNI